MEKITNLTYSKDTFRYAISKILERGSYYGLRSLVVLYMVGEVLKMENAEALEVYGWFTASIIFSKIIGAIFGDLVVGNKRAIIIGAIIQSIGAFILCIPSITGLYIGLFFVVLGSGFYTPNILSNFGKLYLNKIKLLDAAFTLFYFVTNIGAFVGVIVIGYIGKEYGWNMGFIVAGIIILLSIIPILSSNDPITEEPINHPPITIKKIGYILIAIITVSVFWAVFELGSYRTLGLQLAFSQQSTLNIPNSLWSAISSAIYFPISVLAIILWSYFYSTQFFKLMIGCIFGAISFGILFLIPEVPTEQHLAFYLLSILFLGISEIHIGPIINSVLTQYGNPKYLAILISLSIVPGRFLSIIIGLFNERISDDPIIGVIMGLKYMAYLSVGLIIFYIMNKATND